MNDETLAALERAAEFMGSTLWHEETRKDAALIRAHIADLRNGGERAKVVAHLRREAERQDQRDDGDPDGWAFAHKHAADAIEAGAHMGGDDVAAD